MFSSYGKFFDYIEENVSNTSKVLTLKQDQTPSARACLRYSNDGEPVGWRNWYFWPETAGLLGQ